MNSILIDDTIIYADEDGPEAMYDITSLGGDIKSMIKSDRTRQSLYAISILYTTPYEITPQYTKVSLPTLMVYAEHYNLDFKILHTDVPVLEICFLELANMLLIDNLSKIIVLRNRYNKTYSLNEIYYDFKIPLFKAIGIIHDFPRESRRLVLYDNVENLVGTRGISVKPKFLAELLGKGVIDILAILAGYQINPSPDEDQDIPLMDALEVVMSLPDAHKYIDDIISPYHYPIDLTTIKNPTSDFTKIVRDEYDKKSWVTLDMALIANNIGLDRKEVIKRILATGHIPKLRLHSTYNNSKKVLLEFKQEIEEALEETLTK